MARAALVGCVILPPGAGFSTLVRFMATCCICWACCLASRRLAVSNFTVLTPWAADSFWAGIRNVVFVLLMVVELLIVVLELLMVV